jgi:hypothetical protein
MAWAASRAPARGRQTLQRVLGLWMGRLGPRCSQPAFPPAAAASRTRHAKRLPPRRRPCPFRPYPRQLFSMPTTGKLLAVLAVAVPVLLAGGFAYKRAMGCTWGEALTKAYHALGNIPGEPRRRAGGSSGGRPLCGRGRLLRGRAVAARPLPAKQLAACRPVNVSRLAPPGRQQHCQGAGRCRRGHHKRGVPGRWGGSGQERGARCLRGASAHRLGWQRAPVQGDGQS